MTYHSAKSHKTEMAPDGTTRHYSKATCRGQEFVIQDSLMIIDWAQSLIDSSYFIF